MGNLLRRYWLPALLPASAGAGLPAGTRALAGRGPDCLPRHDRRRRVWSPTPVRTAARRCSSGATRRPGCAASTTAGSSTRPAPASTCRRSLPSRISRTRCACKAYPTHESGGIVWTYMGPQDKMQPFRDLGSDSIPQSEWRAPRSTHPATGSRGSRATWTPPTSRSCTAGGRRSSRTGRAGGRRDGPPRLSLGGDARLHPSQRHRRVPGGRGDLVRLPLRRHRADGAGNVNVRVSDFILPLFTYVPQPYLPVGGDSCIMMVPIDDETYWRYGSR